MAETFWSSLDFGVVWRFRDALLMGLGFTLFLAGSGLVGGTILGALFAVAASSPFRLVRWPIRALVEFLRATPLLMQAIWVHFALPIVLGFTLAPTVSAILALTFNVGAYSSEIFRAGIAGIDKGQVEAARALALPTRLVWTKIILPQALRLIVPPLTSSAISTVKASTILSILAINDLMRVAMRINGFTYRPVELYTAAALLFFLVGFAISRLGLFVEKRMERPA